MGPTKSTLILLTNALLGVWLGNVSKLTVLAFAHSTISDVEENQFAFTKDVKG